MMIPKVEKIKRIREKKGLSQRQTSLNAGLPYNSMYRLENRHYTYIHPIRARAIAKALECKVEDIFDLAPSNTKEGKR